MNKTKDIGWKILWYFGGLQLLAGLLLVIGGIYVACTDSIVTGGIEIGTGIVSGFIGLILVGLYNKRKAKTEV